jgi:predicted transposase YdaD
VVLLRPEARAGATGQLQERVSDDLRVDFRYRVIPVWEQPVESLLSGSLGVVPLAPLAVRDESELPQVFRRMADRLDEEATPARADEFWAAGYILSGLRYDRDIIAMIMRGVRRMHESSTYQAILEEGELRGRAKWQRQLLIRQGTSKFGSPNAFQIDSLKAIEDPLVLEELGVRLLTATSWDDLLGQHRIK